MAESIITTQNPVVLGTVTVRTPQGDHLVGTYVGNGTVTFP